MSKIKLPVAPDFEPPLNESLELVHQIKAEVMRLKDELDEARQANKLLEQKLAQAVHLIAARKIAELAAELAQTRQRLATLEAAARAVCGPHEYLGLLMNDIEALGRVLGEVK